MEENSLPSPTSRQMQVNKQVKQNNTFCPYIIVTSIIYLNSLLFADTTFDQSARDQAVLAESTFIDTDEAMHNCLAMRELNALRSAVKRFTDTLKKVKINPSSTSGMKDLFISN